MIPSFRHSCNAVLPLLSSAFTSAPCSSSRRTTSGSPINEALCNGVEPSFLRAFTSAPCSSSNRWTEPPLGPGPSDAVCNGVHPWRSSALMSAPYSISF
ncbi:hypothetical protein BJV77DRAFT_1023607 [Russula vinacea]|nr:hypothetical protein BJV77DRAFT_1023607 [Russula vinacea]